MGAPQNTQEGCVVVLPGGTAFSGAPQGRVTTLRPVQVAEEGSGGNLDEAAQR